MVRVGLESERGDLELNFSAPIGADVEGSHDVGQSSAEGVPSPLREFLEMKHVGKKGEESFDEHAFVPSAPLTDFEVGWIARFGFEAFVAQNDHLVLEIFDEAVEGGVVQGATSASPMHDLALVVTHNGKFGSHNPAPVALALTCDLTLAAAFSQRMNQLDAIAVTHPEKARLGQKTPRQARVLLQQTKQTSALWKMRK